MPRQQGKSPESGRQALRVIGGKWRGRKLGFPAVDGLRPTGDRIRETLFNWLMPELVGARCLDMYAGSGALGIESLSRGAAEVTFIEADAAACRALEGNLRQLEVEAQVVYGSALATAVIEPPFDIVFLDPPFARDLWQSSIDRLVSDNWLAPDALIYIEAGVTSQYSVPESWQLYRDKTAGSVRYSLYLLAARGGN